MRFVRILLLGIFLCVGAEASAQTPTLELKRVLLSLGGVGYFEFEATVTGNVSLQLPVRLDQVDDVLKSIVVFDDKGKVGQITLPGRDSLSQTFKDFPFDQAALGSFDKLLGALSGAEITVTGPSQMSGRILAVVAETLNLPDHNGDIVKHRVTLSSPQGMRQFILEDAEAVSFSDATLQHQVDDALAAMARHRLQDQRVLSISAEGSGSRILRVGYVVAAPLWKSSYRLTALDVAAQGQGLLQGWAVLENLSGRDWTNVELTLASGNPVTFRQQIYDAYFVSRPEVPIDVLARIAPSADRGALESSIAGKARNGAAGAAAAPAAAAVVGQIQAGSAADSLRQREALKTADLLVGETEEGATQVLFSAPEPVSVRSGETLVLPIINRKVPVQRVALYQPNVQPANPLAALRLTNDSGSGLPPGVITLYEQGKSGVAHIGDARLGLTPATEQRLISYAVDYKVQIDQEFKNRTAIAQAKISHGILSLSNRQEQTVRYRIKVPADDDRVLIIEHPRLFGWELVKPKPEEAEISGSVFRIRAATAKGATAVTEVVTQQVQQSSVSLSSLQRPQLVTYAESADLSDAVRKAFARLAVMKGDIEGLESQLHDATEERDQIARDQERLRKNIATVPTNGDLAKRYLEQLKAQEDRLDQLRETTADTQKKLAAARESLAEAIAKLEL